MFLMKVSRSFLFPSVTGNIWNSLLRRSQNVEKQVVLIRNIKSSSVSFSNPPKVNITHKVDNLEKRFLVWTKKYKRIEDVPEYVAPDVMERSRNIMRIRIANIMMVGVLLACLVMVFSGKKAREKGETVEQQNLLWHKAMQEEARTKEQ